jgi:hypothetical protein
MARSNDLPAGSLATTSEQARGGDWKHGVGEERGRTERKMSAAEKFRRRCRTVASDNGEE